MTIAEQDIAAVRFGYGRTPGNAPVTRLADLVVEVSRAPVWPPALADMTSAPRIVQFATIKAARDKMSMESLNVFRMQRYDLFQGNYQRDAHARIAQAVSSPFGFVERLVQFWSNHFTVSTLGPGQVKALAGPFEMEVVRPHLGGRFVDMLIASTRHPAMLIYLNQPASVGPNSTIGKRRKKGLNENLAREVLELHTLGADGGYTQADVTEFARLLTGANFSSHTGGFQFRRAAAEPGPKTILGKTYGGRRHRQDDIILALEDFARHPATAHHIARKLATHFIADVPSPDSIVRLAARFAETDGNLPAVYEVLVTLPEAVSRVGDKRKAPYEFLVSALKAVGARPDWFQPQDNNGKLHPNPLTLGLLFRLDQGQWQAPSPAGWPDQSDRWITPAGLAGRLQWINRVVDHVTSSEPVQFLDDVLGSLATPRTREIVANAASRRSGLALVLASAEFNSR